MTIQCYQQASDYLGSKLDRPLTGRASRIIRRDEHTIAIRYQSTDVVTYHDDGRIVLQSGGWQTSTTKARMTEYSRVCITQSKGVWYVRMGGDWNAEPSLYYDGMIIDADGEPTTPRAQTKTDTARKRELDKKVSAYIKGYAHHIVTKRIIKSL